MERISNELYGHLMRNGLRTKALGTAGVHGMKGPGAADESARRQVAADREGRGGVTSLSQWRTIRVRPSLKIADGGKA